MNKADWFEYLKSHIMREKSSFLNERGLQLVKLKFFCPHFTKGNGMQSRGVNLAHSTSEGEISLSLKKAKIIPL